MAPKCNVVVPLSFLEVHPCDCPTTSHAAAYAAVVRDFVRCRSIVQCASRTCDLWVENPRREQSVLCKCGFRFCFECRLQDREFPDHAPVTCQQQLEWSQKASSLQEDANMKFILSNTRKCPHCGHRQQKTENSCKHVRCGGNTYSQNETMAGSCGKDFCWSCGRKWAECMQSYCNRKNDNEEEIESEIENNKRFLAFFSRYHDVEAWLSTGVAPLISTTLERVTVYLTDPEAYPLLKGDGTEELLKSAVAAEIKGKQILLNTYILSYFLKASPGLALYEECQFKLEQLNESIFKLNRLPLDQLNRVELLKVRDESRRWNAAMVETLAQLRITQAWLE